MSKVTMGQASSTLIPKYIGSDFDKVVTVADNIEDVKQVADAIEEGALDEIKEVLDEIVIVGTNIDAVLTVAEDITSVVTVAANIPTIATVASNIDDVVAVGTNIQQVLDVASITQEVVIVAGYTEDIATVSDSISSVNTVGDNIEYVIDVAEGLTGMPVTVFSGPNPPSVTPIPDGSTWFCTENGKTYIYYVDVDSSQWVECMPQSGFPTEVSGISDTIRDGVVATAPTENAVFDALSGKANSVHTHTPAEAGAAPAVHGHAIADVSGLQGALDGKSPTGHTHTPAEAGAAPASHTHTPSEAGAAPSGHTHALTLAGDATGTATLGPSGVTLTVTVVDDSHAHVIGNVDGLQSALDGKSPTSHTHTPAAIGAAPTSHTHTAAQGNQDIVAGGYGQVGTYGFLATTDGIAEVSPGSTKPGSSLIWSAAEGNYPGPVPSGTWKLLGNCVSGSNVTNPSLWIRVA